MMVGTVYDHALRAHCDHDPHDGRDVDPYGLHVHL